MGRKKSGTKVHVLCHFCKALSPTPIRLHKIVISDYYVCHNCRKNRSNIDSLHEEGKLLVWKMNAAGAWSGYDIRTPTEEDLASMERANEILRAGLSQLRLN